MNDNINIVQQTKANNERSTATTTIRELTCSGQQWAR